ncbi:RICIN domain-containing protein [Bacillus cereus]|uniref:RICIN domain-containing protein n=1 Tax=Bacillus cereus TaxID=1396 RepID=UPI0011A17958|nr:RICIN domain-containing protein [Bacillus cereus]
MVNIDTGKFYKIKNVAFNKVLATSDGNTNNVFVYTDLGSNDQQWAFFKLDDQSYRIVNKANGQTLATTAPENNVFVYKHLPSQDQHWTTMDKQGHVKFKNLNNYLVLASESHKGNVFVYNEIDSAQDQLWDMTPVDSLVMPTLPTDFKKLGPSPTYSSPNDVFPKDDTRVLVGATLIPYFMVNDGNISQGKLVQDNPYYVMEHYQNWHLLDEKTLAPGGEETLTLHTGIRETDQTTITQKSGITIAADAGFNFPIVPAGRADGPFPTVTGDLKSTITNELDVAQSHTSEKMQDTTEIQSVRNPFQEQLQYAKFAIKDTYILKRVDGTQVYEVSAIDTTSIKGASYPNGKEPVSSSRRVVNSRYEVSNPNQKNCECTIKCNCNSN